MKNTHLYYFNWQLQTPVWGVVIDDLLNADIDDEIYFLSCKGALNPCWSNLTGLKSLCELCRFNHKTAFHGIKHKINHIFVDDFIKDINIESLFEKQKYQYSSINDIRKIKYNNISIGYAGLSTYISKTRNREPVIDDIFKNYFNRLLKSQIILKIAIDKIIDIYHPDIISAFNGRVHDTRPVYETAIQGKNQYRGIESEFKSTYEFNRRIFNDALPHSVEYHTKACLSLWENTKYNNEEKLKIAKSFYDGRRKSLLTRDVKIYTDNQSDGLLPAGWKFTKNNIVIYNSSEDEYASIGEEFDSLSLFQTQEEGIKYILSTTKDPDIHYYLRIHPNLKDVNYGYHKRLKKLSDIYTNITIISADSPISTYALMDHADKIIVFGSTTGVEGCYSGKAVILLAAAFFYNLNVAYIPKNTNELVSLISERNLKPKPILGSQMFGFYVMNYEEYSVPVSIIAKPISIFSKTIFYTLPHLTVFGSPVLQKLITLIIRLKYKVINLFVKESQFVIPTKGV